MSRREKRRFRPEYSLGTLGSIPELQERFAKLQKVVDEAGDVGMPEHLERQYGDPDAMSWDAVRAVSVEFGRHGYSMNRGQKDSLHRFLQSFAKNVMPQDAK